MRKDGVVQCRVLTIFELRDVVNQEMVRCFLQQHAYCILLLDLKEA